MPYSSKEEKYANQLQQSCDLNSEALQIKRRQTNIVCTIGRASRNVEMIEQLILAGASVIRLNFSHDTHEQHAEAIALIREASHRASRKVKEHLHVAIAMDTKGPEIRTGLIAGGREVELEKNDVLRLSISKDMRTRGNDEAVFIDYPNIITVVKPGARIYLNDGYIKLMVFEVSVDGVICQVLKGGTLVSYTPVAIPGAELNLEEVSDRDVEDLRFAVAHRADFIFASKLTTPLAIKEIRCVLGERGKKIQLFTKLDSVPILNHLDEVIKLSDGIVLDRSSLGVEIPYHKFFLVQKAIIETCNRAGKPIVVGTQLLETMRTKQAPTRADIADVGNIVIDGADALMLGYETAVGKYPVEAVHALDLFCFQAEAAVWNRKLYKYLSKHYSAALDSVYAIATGAMEAVRKAKATCILVVTTSGKTANLLSMFRPNCTILAVTKSGRTARQLHLRRGVVPILYRGKPAKKFAKDVDLRVKYGLVWGKRLGLVETEDTVVVVAPWKEGTGICNNIRVIYVCLRDDPEPIEEFPPIKLTFHP